MSTNFENKKFVDNTQDCFAFHPKQTFPHIIWIFIDNEGDGIKFRLPFKIFSTLFYDRLLGEFSKKLFFLFYLGWKHSTPVIWHTKSKFLYTLLKINISYRVGKKWIVDSILFYKISNWQAPEVTSLDMFVPASCLPCMSFRPCKRYLGKARLHWLSWRK